MSSIIKLINLHFPALNDQKKESRAGLFVSEIGNAYAVEDCAVKQPIVENKGQR